MAVVVGSPSCTSVRTLYVFGVSVYVLRAPGMPGMSVFSEQAELGHGLCT